MLNASTRLRKWGSKEYPTLDNVGPHDIIICQQTYEFAIRGERQLSNFLFWFILFLPIKRYL